jgi:hypothetical protein
MKADEAWSHDPHSPGHCTTSRCPAPLPQPTSDALSRSPSLLVIDDLFLLDSASPAASLIYDSVQALAGHRVCVGLCCRDSASIPSDIRSPANSSESLAFEH